MWSCCGVLGGRPLRWLVFRNTHVRWFVAEVTASTTPTHRAAVPERRNTDRTKDKKISYLGGIPVRLVHPGRPRRPTDRRSSMDEHTKKRQVELTSILQKGQNSRVLLIRGCSPMSATCAGLVHSNRKKTPGSRVEVSREMLRSKATSLPSCSSETRKCNPYGSRRYATRAHYLPR